MMAMQMLTCARAHTTPRRESRARQLDESREREELLDLKLSKLRSATRLLWGVFQEMQMRIAEQQTSVQAGNELLESLDGLLEAENRVPPSANAHA